MGCHTQKEHAVGSDELGPCESRTLDPNAQLWLTPQNASSPWLSPWKAYQDTWPGDRLRQAAGVHLAAGQTDAMAALVPKLAAAGFRRISFPVPWNVMRYDQPQLVTAEAQASLTATLRAAKANGMRPTLRVYAPPSAPTPLERVTLPLAKPAQAGDRQLWIAPESVPLVAVGRTGVDEQGIAAAALITAIDASGTAQLSRALKEAQPGPTLVATKLKYAPLVPRLLPAGDVNPIFEESLNGFAAFVRGVAELAKAVMGPNGFDVVLWDSDSDAMFFWADRYSDQPQPEPNPLADQVLRDVVAETAARVSLESPLPFTLGDSVVDLTATSPENASIEPAAVTAIVRRNVMTLATLPAAWGPTTFPALNAQGSANGAAAADGTWAPTFLPAVTAFFPERPLTALMNSNVRPGQIYRDISPIPTNIGLGGWHGRTIKNQGQKLVSVWTDPAGLRLPDMQGAELTNAQRDRLLAKFAMRSLAAFVSKGAGAVHLEADPLGHGVVDRWVDGSGAASPVARFLNVFTGADAGEPVWFSRVQSCDQAKQFAGDGTPAHPDLLNRDVVFAAPFRLSPSRVAIVAYVMTYDLLAPAAAARDEAHKYDLAPAVFGLTFVGTNVDQANVRAFDPLENADVQATVLSRRPRTLTLNVELTDSPRIITLEGL